MGAVASRPFAAVFRTEVLFNLKRVVPYALTALFGGNALLWWGWGPAGSRGWAVNSDFYIVWLFCGFSFMTMPLFIAVMMGDPVIRDFSLSVDPLIFSKPVRRAEYLLGKFFGNFFVLVCCQACFALTPMLLQFYARRGMLVLEPRVLPYFEHFFFFVVLSSLAPAALFFTVGALTRNVKMVYGLAVSFYPLYVAWQLLMKGLPYSWRVALDPVLANVGVSSWQGRSAEWLNALVISYDAGMVANRVLMVCAALACLAVLHARFSVAGRAKAGAPSNPSSTLGLAETPEGRLYAGGRVGDDSPRGDARSLGAGERTVATPPASSSSEGREAAGDPRARAALPLVTLKTRGAGASFAQFRAALGVEFRLLRAERSLVVVAPLVVFVCGLELAAYGVAPEPSYAAAYAGRAADALLLFLFGVAVFYSGETMHRDRELRVEPVLWSAPAPDSVLLLSKFAATLLLSASLTALVGLTAAALQLFKGHAPLDLPAHLKTYAVITLPSALFMCAAAVALNVALRDKYLAYAAGLAAGGAVYHLASRGPDTWLYNPVLQNLWTPADLASGGARLTRILLHRVYCASLSSFLLSVAFVLFGRGSQRGLTARGSLTGRGRAFVAAAASALAAVVAGLLVENFS